MHNHSAKKVPLIEKSIESYGTALRVLPELEPEPKAEMGKGSKGRINTSRSTEERKEQGDGKNLEEDVNRPATTVHTTPKHCRSTSSSLTPSPLRIRKISVSFTADTNSWLLQRSVERYNAQLLSFAAQLRRHVEIVSELYHWTVKAQRMEYASEEMETRVERLRANGWKRERFDSGRYEALGRMAWVELGV
ncbi:hypothetical protein MMC20_006017 [Loxospora ochrophaea]|nr:hypothetical protein [Loxospora ochrophaea]